jgi:hypothetical protein
LTVTVGGSSKSSYARRIDTWRESLNGIGRFEVLLDNAGSVLSNLTPESVVVLGVNGSTLMTGYLDDVVPFVNTDPSAVYEETVKFVGRDYGQDLANLFLEKEYFNIRVDNIIDDALNSTGSEITFTSPSSLSQKDVSFKKDYLVDRFRDLVKKVDCDFYVDDSKAFKLFTLASPEASNVTLQSVAANPSNNILSLEGVGGLLGFDIRNYVYVYAGDVDDHWTEGNDLDFTAINCTVFNDVAEYLAGQTSLVGIASASDAAFMLDFPCYDYDALDFSDVGSVDCHALVRHNDGVDRTVFILLSDGLNLIYYRTDPLASSTWRKITFPMGPDNQINSTGIPIIDAWEGTNSTFDWSTIDRLGITMDAVGNGSAMWFDGLYLNGVDARSVAENSTSQGLYRKRMIPIYRPDLKSQRQLDLCADDELAKRKFPLQSIRVLASGQTGLRYAGQTVTVNAPTSGVNSTLYRSLTIHHMAEPTVDLFKGNDFVTELDLVRHETASVQPTDPLRFKLYSEPVLTLYRRAEERIHALERG